MFEKREQTKAGATELREEEVEPVQGGWKTTVDNIAIGNFKGTKKKAPLGLDSMAEGESDGI